MISWSSKVVKLAWANAVRETTEIRLFLGYALIVFRPGADPPNHPNQEGSSSPVPHSWSIEEYELYIAEARLDMTSQQAEKRDIRARAQVILTTALIAGGALATSFSRKSEHCACEIVFYSVSAASIILAALAAAGIITAVSPIGAPNLRALPLTATGRLHRRLADEYAASRHQGAATIAVLVTVLRDAVLVLLVGAGTLAIAHVLAS